MTQTLMMTARYFFTELAEIILEMKDFFVFKRHITLSELFLFAWTCSRATWFAIFGVVGGIFTMALPGWFWITVFMSLAIFKAISLVVNRYSLRIAGVFVSALIWTTMTILAAIAGRPEPILPTYGLFALLSIIIAVRLIHDESRNEN
jgi:hypothetical protein